MVVESETVNRAGRRVQVHAGFSHVHCSRVYRDWQTDIRVACEPTQGQCLDCRAFDQQEEWVTNEAQTFPANAIRELPIQGLCVALAMSSDARWVATVTLCRDNQRRPSTVSLIEIDADPRNALLEQSSNILHQLDPTNIYDTTHCDQGISTLPRTSPFEQAGQQRNAAATSESRAPEDNHSSDDDDDSSSGSRASHYPLDASIDSGLRIEHSLTIHDMLTNTKRSAILPLPFDKVMSSSPLYFSPTSPTQLFITDGSSVRQLDVYQAVRPETRKQAAHLGLPRNLEVYDDFWLRSKVVAVTAHDQALISCLCVDPLDDKFLITGHHDGSVYLRTLPRSAHNRTGDSLSAQYEVEAIYAKQALNRHPQTRDGPGSDVPMSAEDREDSSEPLERVYLMSLSASAPQQILAAASHRIQSIVLWAIERELHYSDAAHQLSFKVSLLSQIRISEPLGSLEVDEHGLVLRWIQRHTLGVFEQSIAESQRPARRVRVPCPPEMIDGSFSTTCSANGGRMLVFAQPSTDSLLVCSEQQNLRSIPGLQLVEQPLMSMTPNGNKVAVVCRHRVCVVTLGSTNWNAECSVLALSGNAQLVARCGHERFVSVYDVSRLSEPLLKVELTANSNYSMVSSVCFTDTGDYLAILESTGVVVLEPMHSNKGERIELHLNGCTVEALTCTSYALPDGCHALVVAMVCSDAVLRVWSSAHPHRLLKCYFSPEARCIDRALPSTPNHTANRHGNVASDKSQRRTVSSTKICLAPNCRSVAVVVGARLVQVWDLGAILSMTAATAGYRGFKQHSLNHHGKVIRHSGSASSLITVTITEDFSLATCSMQLLGNSCAYSATGELAIGHPHGLIQMYDVTNPKTPRRSVTKYHIPRPNVAIHAIIFSDNARYMFVSYKAASLFDVTSIFDLRRDGCVVELRGEMIGSASSGCMFALRDPLGGVKSVSFMTPEIVQVLLHEYIWQLDCQSGKQIASYLDQSILLPTSRFAQDSTLYDPLLFLTSRFKSNSREFSALIRVLPQLRLLNLGFFNFSKDHHALAFAVDHNLKIHTNLLIDREVKYIKSYFADNQAPNCDFIYFALLPWTRLIADLTEKYPRLACTVLSMLTLDVTCNDDSRGPNQRMQRDCAFIRKDHSDGTISNVRTKYVCYAQDDPCQIVDVGGNTTDSLSLAARKSPLSFSTRHKPGTSKQSLLDLNPHSTSITAGATKSIAVIASVASPLTSTASLDAQAQPEKRKPINRTDLNVSQPILHVVSLLPNIVDLSYWRDSDRPDPLEMFALHNVTPAFSLPVVRSMLDFRWTKVQHYFYIQVAVYVVFVISASLFSVHMATDPIGSILADVSQNDPSSVRVAAGVIALILNLWFILTTITEVRTAGARAHFRDTWSVVHLLAHILVPVVAALHIAQDDAQFTVGAITVVLIWLGFLSFMRGFRGADVYIKLVFAIAYEIRYFMLVWAVVLLGFANAYILLFRAATPEYSQFGIALVSVFAGSTGGLPLIVRDPHAPDFDFAGEPQRYNLQLIMFVLFTLICNVLLLNMLIAQMGSVYADITAASSQEHYLEKAKLLLSLERLFLHSESQLYRGAWLHIVAPEHRSEFWTVPDSILDSLTDELSTGKAPERIGSDQHDLLSPPWASDDKGRFEQSQRANQKGMSANGKVTRVVDNAEDFASSHEQGGHHEDNASQARVVVDHIGEDSEVGVSSIHTNECQAQILQLLRDLQSDNSKQRRQIEQLSTQNQIILERLSTFGHEASS